jgi:hypothetical protein
MIAPWDVPCSEETVRPNLELKERQHVFGELKDPSGAPFIDSKVILRVADAKGKFVSNRSVSTDKEGQFDLGQVDAGKYRFLPGPNRGWKQPRMVECREGRDCEIKLVVQLNPSDQPFAGCPIQ